jgi:hypothetical protein
MTTPTASPRPRSRAAVWTALVLAAALGGLTVMVATGLAAEYGDTSASQAEVAWTSLRSWALGLVLTAAVAGAGAWLARGSRLVAGVAAGIVVVTCVGVPVGSVLGVQQKLERYGAVPDCTDGFSRGPAVPATEAAQEGFESLDHPGVFAGGGSAGVDGCSTQLMTRGGVDVREHYRGLLPQAGWVITSDTDGMLRATKDSQAFEVTSPGVGTWEIWIGPSELERQPLDEGQVGLRT